MEITDTDVQMLIASIQLHEGLALKPIPDAKNSLVIGWGRSLTFTGISRSEADYLLENDLQRVRASLSMHWPPFLTCDGPRQRVLVEMGYQLGVEGLLLFKNMLHAIATGDHEAAARSVLASRLATQTPSRAQFYAETLRS